MKYRLLKEAAAQELMNEDIDQNDDAYNLNRSPSHTKFVGQLRANEARAEREREIEATVRESELAWTTRRLVDYIRAVNKINSLPGYRKIMRLVYDHLGNYPWVKDFWQEDWDAEGRPSRGSIKNNKNLFPDD